jgi:hypothetical protein
MKRFLIILAKAALAAFFMPAWAGVSGPPGGIGHAGHMPEIDASALAPSAPGYSNERIRPTAEMPTPDTIGAVRMFCDQAEQAFNDPLVFPGKEGASHLHTFVGAKGSTLAPVEQATASTCRGGTINTSRYWAPTMVGPDGKPIPLAQGIVYYKTGYNGILPAQINPLPQGLRMIAGDMRNTALAGPYEFKCIGPGVPQLWSLDANGVAYPDTGTPYNKTKGKFIPPCPAGSALWSTVMFPQCVALGADGLPLIDSPDHKAHLAYTVSRPDRDPATMRYGRWCPTTHPYPIPQVDLVFIYQVPPEGTGGWILSSDTLGAPRGPSSHADLEENWNRVMHLKVVNECLNDPHDCHGHLVGIGLEMY